jgi:hypothetical protein
MPVLALYSVIASVALMLPPDLGEQFPAYLQASCVRGSMPVFRDPARPALVAFVRLGDPSIHRVMPALDATARRFGSGVGVVAIAEESEQEVRQFADLPDWTDRLSFTVAADPARIALRTVFGPTATPVLPTAFVVRDGTVVWQGAPDDAEDVLVEVIAGRWDVAEARRAADARRAWEAQMARVDGLAAAGRADEALTALDAACASASDGQRAGCPVRRFGILVDAGRVDEAVQAGEAILRAPSGDRQGAGMAWTIARKVPGNRAALAFALRAATASDRAVGGRDAMVAGVLARVQYLSGDREAAAATVRRALPLAETSEARRSLQEDLGVYDPPKARRPGSAGS